MSDFCGAVNCCTVLLAGDEKPTLVALIRYKMYLKIKQRQGFPVSRTRHKIHFSLNYLYLKSQFNTHAHSQIHTNTIKDFFNPEGREKQGGKPAATFVTTSSNVAALM